MLLFFLSLEYYFFPTRWICLSGFLSGYTNGCAGTVQGDCVAANKQLKAKSCSWTWHLTVSRRQETGALLDPNDSNLKEIQYGSLQSNAVSNLLQAWVGVHFVTVERALGSPQQPYEHRGMPEWHQDAGKVHGLALKTEGVCGDTSWASTAGRVSPAAAWAIPRI